jgi:thioredoxin 2
MGIVTCTNCGTKNRVNTAEASSRVPVCGKCGQPLKLTGGAPADTGKPLHVTDADFSSVVSRADDRPVLIDCWAEWCGPCRIVGPIMDQLAAEANGRYIIGKLDVDNNPRTSAQYKIQSIPTMLVFKNGKLVDRLVGAQPKQVIATKLAAYV